MSELKQELGGELITRQQMKSPERILVKANRVFGGDVSRVGDVWAGTLVFDTEDELLDALGKLREREDLVHLDNRWFRPKKSSGYRDIISHLALDDGTVVELQLQLKDMQDVKDGVGHSIYEFTSNNRYDDELHDAVWAAGDISKRLYAAAVDSSYKDLSAESKETLRRLGQELAAVEDADEAVRAVRVLQEFIDEYLPEKAAARPTIRNTESSLAIDPIADMYIRPTPEAVIMPMDSLVPTEKVTSMSVAKARRNMQAALEGDMSKRKPLTVRRKTNSDGTHSIIDGNNTYAALKELGAKNVPVTFVGGDSMLAKYSRILESTNPSEIDADNLNAGNDGFISDETVERYNQQDSFHGTGHIIMNNRMDLSKVGSGEGGAYRGWGIYSAQAKGVAETYRKFGLTPTLTVSFKDGRSFTSNSAIEADENGHWGGLPDADSEEYTQDFEILWSVLDDIERETIRLHEEENIDYKNINTYDVLTNVKRALRKDIAYHQGRFEEARTKQKSHQQLHIGDEFALENAQSIIKYNTDMLGLIDSIEGISMNSVKGNIYNLGVADDYLRLDWDASLDEQPEHVKKAIEKISSFIHRWAAISGFDTKYFDNSQNGGALYMNIVYIMGGYLRNHHPKDGVTGAKKRTSLLFNRFGVPGLRFLDRFSRHDNTGEHNTHNFVTWNEDFIEVTGIDPSSDQEAINYFNKYKEEHPDGFITSDAIEHFDQLVTHATGNIIYNNRFDLRYVGSSEGSSAFGHGAYFEQSRAVAEVYRRFGLKNGGKPIVRMQTYDGKEINNLELDNYDTPLEDEMRYLLKEITEEAETLGSVSWKRIKSSLVRKYKGEVASCEKAINGNGFLQDAKDRARDILNRAKYSLEVLNNIRSAEIELGKKGNIYNFEIPEDYELLDWDESLENQSKEVTPIIMKIVEAINNNPAELIAFGFAQGTKNPKIAQTRLQRIISSLMKKYRGHHLDSYEFRALPEYKRLKSILRNENTVDNLRYAINNNSNHRKMDTSSATGETLYWKLTDLTGSKVNASMYLNQQGIPGHRFWDRGSREEGKGTHNFVIWNMDKVKMLGLTPDSDQEARDYFNTHRDRQLELFDGNSEHYSQLIADNIKRGNEAMHKVISEHTDVIDAMFRDDLGGISFLWGTPGRGARFKGGKGVSHIIAHRNAQGYNGEAVARKMVDVIAKGDIARRYGQNVPNGERADIYHDGYTAVLSLYNDGEKQTWLLTGFKNENPVAAGEGNGSSSATLNSPMRTRTDEGAGISAQSLPSNAPSVNNSYTQTDSGQDYFERYKAEHPEDASYTDNNLITPRQIEHFDQLAYHGTDNTILGNMFDLRYVGSSEGGSAYGYGAYFAGNILTAESYRHFGDLADGKPQVVITTKDGRTFRSAGAYEWEYGTDTSGLRPAIDDLRFMAEGADNIDIERMKKDLLKVYKQKLREQKHALSLLKKELKTNPHSDTQERVDLLQYYVYTYIEKINALDSISAIEVLPPKKGNVYTFDLPENYELLDWEARMPKQPEMVRKARREILAELKKLGLDTTDFDTKAKAGTNPTFLKLYSPYIFDASNSVWDKLEHPYRKGEFLSTSKLVEAVEKGHIGRNMWEHYDSIILRGLNDTNGDGIILLSLLKPSKAKTDHFNIRSIIDEGKDIDARYFEALKAGDMDTARTIIDEQARKKGYSNDDSFRMSHRAPVSSDHFGPNMAEVMTSGIVPDDYWTHPEYYLYTDEEKDAYHEVLSALRRYKDNHERGIITCIRIYRAVPNNVKDSHLRNGDWVTPSRAYAVQHGLDNLNGNYRIISENVPLKYLWWDGNSIAEWGYDDNEHDYVYRNTKNNRKLNDTVTYDDEGDIVLPSKRFNYRAEEIYHQLIGKQGAERLNRTDWGSISGLNEAKQLDKDGMPTFSIWRITGWGRGVDGA